jgi:hypothetical protein
MSDDDGQPNGGFTHKELQLIFERAGQIEAAAPEPAYRRYSLSEIQEIGRQAGLTPVSIERAAATVRAEPASRRYLGEGSRFNATRLVENPLSEAGVSDVVLRIRDATGLHGDVRLVPGGIEWRARHASGATIVDFTPRRGGTRVDVTLAREDAAAGTAIGMGFLGFVTTIVTGVALVPAAGPIAGVGVAAAAGVAIAWGGARLIWARSAARWKQQSAELVETIADAVAKSSSQTDS